MALCSGGAGDLYYIVVIGNLEYKDVRLCTVHPDPRLLMHSIVDNWCSCKVSFMLCILQPDSKRREAASNFCSRCIRLVGKQKLVIWGSSRDSTHMEILWNSHVSSKILVRRQTLGKNHVFERSWMAWESSCFASGDFTLQPCQHTRSGLCLNWIDTEIIDADGAPLPRSYASPVYDTRMLCYPLYMSTYIFCEHSNRNKKYFLDESVKCLRMYVLGFYAHILQVGLTILVGFGPLQGRARSTHR